MSQVMKRYMPPPPSPAPPSPFEWGRPERIRELLLSAFQLRFEKGVSYYREPSAEAAWNTFSTGYGPTPSLAGNLDPDRRAALRDDFIAFHAIFATDVAACSGTRKQSDGHAEHEQRQHLAEDQPDHAAPVRARHQVSAEAGLAAPGTARRRAARASRRVESSVGRGEFASSMISGISVQPRTTASQPSPFMRVMTCWR